MPKQRIQIRDLLVERGLAPDRQRAEAFVLAGRVRIGDQVVRSAGQKVELDTQISVEEGREFVSRAGQKLQGALKAFAINLSGARCADVGSSTGGFTEVLLQHGALKVYAIDVGYGELAWKLRTDARVVVLERTNARELSALPEQITFASIDVSFISLRLILPQVRIWFGSNPLEMVALLKPQFEAAREEVPSGGVIIDSELHRRIVRDFLKWSAEHRFNVAALHPSSPRGNDGNQEFFVRISDTAVPLADIEREIEALLASPSIE